MKLEDQVLSLELAKKLKSLGVKQESYFNWITENEIGDEWEERVEVSDYSFDCPIEIIASAFTVAELGEILPHEIPDGRTTPWHFRSYWELGRWGVSYASTGVVLHKVSANTEANARALMLIYLLENNHIPSLTANNKE